MSETLTLPEAVWLERAARHRQRLEALLGDYLAARRRGARHPVIDFLFEYYAFRPGRLMRWSPGFGVVLAGEAARSLLEVRGFVEDARGGVRLEASLFPEARRAATRWVAELLRRTRDRAPFFGCCGMHEWAMVYRTSEVRHGQLPLRLAPDALAAFVESQPIVCSHYDAFRFFTEPARPLNRLQPAADAMLDNEQPGCLHANMDVYRWASKLYPWVDSDLIADAFMLALRIRVLDMRASPYDLSALGFAPVRVETAEGRREYAAQQRAFAAEAAPLRARLIVAVERLVAALDEAATDPAAC